MTDRTEIRPRIWHALYRRWYDHRAAGHKTRAAIYGWAADQAISILYPTR
jgi:hypothetical protein